MSRIALVVLDTLRKDYFDAHFDWLPGARFESAWSTSQWTKPVHASLFTGRYASETGMLQSMHFDCNHPAIAEVLRDAGYTTRAFSTNSHIAEPFDFDRGFDEFWNGLQFISNDNRRYIDAAKYCFQSAVRTDKALRLALNHRRYEDKGAAAARHYVSELSLNDNEFLFMNLIEPHHPYTVVSEFREHPQNHGPGNTIDFIEWTMEENDSMSNYFKRLYEDTVRYLSHIYRDTFEKLASKFDYVITLADHGELFGEDGGWMHWFGLHPKLVNVPLVVSSTNQSTETISRPVSLLDVHKTILDLTGIHADSRGNNLFSSKNKTARLTECHGGMSDGLQTRFSNESKYDIKRLKNIIKNLLV